MGTRFPWPRSNVPADSANPAIRSPCGAPGSGTRRAVTSAMLVWLDSFEVFAPISLSTGNEGFFTGVRNLLANEGFFTGNEGPFPANEVFFTGE